MNKYKQSIDSTLHIPEFKGVSSGGGDTLVEFHQSDIKYKVDIHFYGGGKDFYMVDKEFFPYTDGFSNTNLNAFCLQHVHDIKFNPLEPYSKFAMFEVDDMSWADWQMMIQMQTQVFFVGLYDDQRLYFPLAFLPYMEKFANYIEGSFTSTEEVPPLAPGEEDVLLGYLLPVKTMDNMLNTLKQL